MKRSMITGLGAITVMLMTAGMANASLTLVQVGPDPAGSTSLFTAVETLNFGNQKARLEAAGRATLQGGNPGNGWFNNVLRSWEVDWNNTTGVVTFNVYASSDWTGTAAMTMTQTPVFTAGNVLLGLDIGARLAINPSSTTIGNVQFNDDSGFVAVPAADATYNAPPSAFFNNYFSLVGTLGDFGLRGTTIFPTGTTTGDSMRNFIDARQGVAGPASSVPEPPSLMLLSTGLLGLVISVRRNRIKKRSATT